MKANKHTTEIDRDRDALRDLLRALKAAQADVAQSSRSALNRQRLSKKTHAGFDDVSRSSKDAMRSIVHGARECRAQ